MNYKKHYDLLVDRAKTRTIEGYVENHHVIPRCLGGSDEKENIVSLTPEEHYLAHLLLVKMFPGNIKLVFAANMMVSGSKFTTRSNKRYGWLRKKHSESMRILSTTNNSQQGTIWMFRGEEVVKIKKENAIEFKELGFEFGRKPKKEKQPRQIGLMSEKYRWILEQSESVLSEFDSHKSVNRILMSRGFSGREGNKILSDWLRTQGRNPLRRRNSLVSHSG